MAILWTDKLNAVSAALGVVFTATISIVLACVSNRAQEQLTILNNRAQAQAERLALETRTIEAMNDVNRRISDIVTYKRRHDDEKKIPIEKWFDYDYVHADKEVEDLVFRLLNEYDYVCLGGNEKLFSNDIIKKIRGDALQTTWTNYKEYITTYRKAENKPNAWRACDEWLARLAKGT